MVNRTLCDVLNEMRACIKTANYSYLPGLVEEAQTMGNKMEMAIWDQSDIKKARSEHKRLKKKIKKLKERIDEASS